MKLKNVVIEFVWLSIILLISFAITALLVRSFGPAGGWIRFGRAGNLIGIPVWEMMLDIFLVLCFISYAIKEAFHAYRHRAGNIILLINIILLNILTGLDLYGTNRAVAILNEYTPAPDFFTKLRLELTITQIFLLVLLVIIAFVTIRKWNADWLNEKLHH